MENLRAAFNQVKVLKENGYGEHGEYVGLDVKAMRTTKDEDSYKHLENSLKIFKALEEKVDRFELRFPEEMRGEPGFRGIGDVCDEPADGYRVTDIGQIRSDAGYRRGPDAPPREGGFYT